MNFLRRSSTNVTDVVNVLNILKSNPIMIEDAFKFVLGSIADQVDLHKLIMTLVQNEIALVGMVRCIGSPHEDIQNFSRWLQGFLQRALMVSPEEYAALKDCYAEVYSSVTDGNEKMNVITKWVLEQNRKNPKDRRLKRLLDFIKSSENLPGYNSAPSYEPPHYTSLYTSEYKQLPYGPRAYGGARIRRRRTNRSLRSTR